jgi:hypothetical protein
MSQVVSLLTERKARRSNDEIFAEVLPVTGGGIMVVTETDNGAEFVWELDCAQARTVIQALALAVLDRQTVKIIQPVSSICSVLACVLVSVV